VDEVADEQALRRRIERVKAEIATYRELQSLLAEWIDTSIELDRLRRARRAPANTSR